MTQRVTVVVSVPADEVDVVKRDLRKIMLSGDTAEPTDTMLMEIHRKLSGQR